MKKKFLIFICLILFIVSIAGVSAADDVNQVVDDTLSVSQENNEVLNDNPGTYSQLIDEAGSGGNITLTKSIYTYDSGGTINITQPGVIDGKGAIIDMTGSYLDRVFSIESDGVTLKNMVFKNLDYADSYDSGDDYNPDDDGSGDGHELGYNDDGGVIYIGSFKNLEIINCTFSDNGLSSESLGGSAIFIDEQSRDIKITDCSFENNEGPSMEGGGAIRIESAENIEIDNCRFNENSAYNNGGAVYIRSSNYVSISNSDFKNNRAIKGGAVLNAYSSNITMDNNDFTDNHAVFEGGAVSISYGHDVYISNSSFKNNALSSEEANYGGAISISVRSDVFIYDSSFENNKASSDEVSYGGAIATVSNMAPEYNFRAFLLVDNCNFTSNVVDSEFEHGGGAIYNGHGDNSILSNCNFINNVAKGYGDEYISGGAVYWEGENGTVSNCNFVENSASTGGALYWDAEEGLLKDSNFNNNSAILNGGAVSANKLNVNNCNFTDCSSLYQGGALNVFGTVNVTKSNFDNNSATYYGGALFFTSGNIENSNFTNNWAFGIFEDGYEFGSGGAVWLQGSANLTNCNFINNTATSGGALEVYDIGGYDYSRISSLVSVSNCQFVNNNATLGGSAIGSCSNITIEKSSFIENKGDKGALYFNNELSYKHPNMTISLTDIEFKDNTPGDYGGGITFYDGILSLSVYSDGFDMAREYASGEVSVDIAGESFKKAFDSEGKVDFDLSSVSSGTWDTMISYSENGKFSSFKANIPLTIESGEPSINLTASDVTKYYGGPESLEITLTKNALPVSGANITVNLNGKNESVTTDNKGKAYCELDLDVGVYDAVAYYKDIAADAKVTVNQASTNTTLSFSVNGKNVTLTATVNSTNPTGEVVFTVNGENYTASLADSKATYALSNLTAGNYTAKAAYTGDVNHKSSISNDVSFNISDYYIVINAPDLIKYYHGPERFTANLTDNEGNPVTNVSVNFTINGITYARVTDSNGIASMAINLNSGVYPITTRYDVYEFSSTVTIKETVSGENITKMFRNGTQYYATFYDTAGNTLANNTAVEFNINGVFYTRYTNEKGVARMNINLNPGEYVITAKNPNSTEQYTNIITVLPTIVENYDLTKYYKNASQYSLRILDEKGNPVKAGVAVRLNINGVFYTRTSNDDGYVKLNINLEPGEYTITAEYNGLMASNKIKVLSVIETHDLVMKYKDGSKFEAKILDGQGKAYSGQKVTFNINGVFYERITGDDGIARLNINLMAGEYIITSSYNGMNAANKVTISS